MVGKPFLDDIQHLHAFAALSDAVSGFQGQGPGQGYALTFSAFYHHMDLPQG